MTLVTAGIQRPVPVRSDATREHESVSPVGTIQTVTPNSPIAFARLDRRAIALVQADMRDDRLARVGRKKEEITSLQAAARRLARSCLVDGATRKVDAEFLIHVLREARAIECVRTFRTPDIWASDQLGREIDGILRERAGGDEKADEYRVRNSANHEITWL